MASSVALGDGNNNNVVIDDALYSRQRYVLGDKAMSKMARSHVLVSGLGGLGVEIAKNIVLAGVKSLTLHDTVLTTVRDLGTQFFLQGSSSLGQNRATSSEKMVAQLNPYVAVSSVTHDFSIDLSYLNNFTCVILTEAPLKVAKEVNEYCRGHNIAFILAEVRGVFGWVFDDFGESFNVWDKNGEEAQETFVAKITSEKEGVVTCLEHHLHGLEDGDVVTFREVKGTMQSINGSSHVVKVISPSSFSIGDTTSFGEYERDGVVVQQKIVVNHSFKSLSQSLEEPEFNVSDYSKFENPAQLHLGMQGLHQYWATKGSLPRPWNSEDAAEFLKLVEEINNQTPSSVARKVEVLNVKLLSQLAFTSQGSLAPITGFLGGVVAQEALKAVTGKYTPLKQWLYFDAVELLPSNSEQVARGGGADFQPIGSRYDAQIICLGKETQILLQNTRLLMVGCGAIGCEMMKNYAMLGVSASFEGNGEEQKKNKGRIVITDNDLIEKSNLNRQFLFRSKDIQTPKSTTAARAVLEMMNSDMEIVANLDRMGPQTEDKYSDEFFQDLDVVVNALDNVAARLYMDGRCVTNQRPLLESGTLGTKGHVQTVVPYKSESYGSQRDPPEKDVPFCTLKSFPNSIEHTIQWARDFVFENLLSSKPTEFNKFWEEDPNVLTKLRSTSMGGGGGVKPGSLRLIAKLLRQQPVDFEACIAYARLKFQRFYRSSIHQLLHNFPVDHKLKDGSLFWSSPKRPPTALEFDVNNDLHFEFVKSFSILWAEVWGVGRPCPDQFTRDLVAKVCSGLVLPQFQPKSGKVIITDENAKKPEATAAAKTTEEEDREWAQVILGLQEKKLRTQSTFPPKLKPMEFEKDDDSNLHVDLINASSNLRATVYSIPVSDRLQTKRIAGRIMPAIATTTAAVSGLVGVELIKLVKRLPSLGLYRNAFMNLALPLFAFSEPAEAGQSKISKNMSISLWDRWDVKESVDAVTIADFVKHFEKKYALTVTGICQDVQMIYVPHFPAHKKRLPDRLSKWLKRPIEDVKYLDLIVSFENEDEEEVNGPAVRFFFAPSSSPSSFSSSSTSLAPAKQ